MLSAAAAGIVNLVGMPAMAETLSSYLEVANAELATKQAAFYESLEAFQPYSYRWDTDARKLLITRSSSGEVLKEFELIPVGAYNAQQGTWLWSWANKSVPRHLDLVKSFAPLAEQFPEHKSFVTAAPIEVEPIYGQDMTAAAIKHLGGIGMWRDGDPGGVVVYFVVME